MDNRSSPGGGGRSPGAAAALVVGLAILSIAFALGAGAGPAFGATTRVAASSGSPAGPTVDPSASPTPAPTPTPTPAPTPIVTSRNVYRTGAAVHQCTIYWCVPASAQTMLNIVLRDRPVDSARISQTRLAKAIGTQNRYHYTVPGNDIRGWAKALNQRIPASDGVRYRDRAFRSRTVALWEIVHSIDRTGFPVGITVWHGRHAWTVTGYRTSQLPNRPATRTILGFYVTGPLHSARHVDPFPMKYVSLATFVANFTWYDEDHKRPPWHGAYVMVRPELVLATPGW
jgi:hypothetical protein